VVACTESTRKILDAKLARDNSTFSTQNNYLTPENRANIPNAAKIRVII